MTNAERRERRRQAGLKGTATRRARLGQVVQDQAEPPQLVGPTAEPPRLETADERARRAESAAEKRLENLRAVIRRAQEIRRESDLYSYAHSHRWHHSPRRWTAAQIDDARRFLDGFIRPDGKPQSQPIRRKGKWRL